jgi:IS5 family transposase
MFRTVGDQPPLWESLLPPEVLRLPGELARVDALLDDPVFFAPFAPYFHPVLGRPSTPVECYLRLMFLKFRYRRPPDDPVSRGHRAPPSSTKSQVKRHGRGFLGIVGPRTLSYVHDRRGSGFCCDPLFVWMIGQRQA